MGKKKEVETLDSKKVASQNLDPTSRQYFDRCKSLICAPCRKHVSCFIYPIKGKCGSQEIGPAWNHTCGGPNEIDYSEFD